MDTPAKALQITHSAAFDASWEGVHPQTTRCQKQSFALMFTNLLLI
jgi:hypothetical protein